MNRADAITRFSNTVKSIRSKLARRSTYSMWIRFKVGKLNIDTSSQNLYGSSANYMLSLENVKNGSGSANSFTISIVYVPKPGEDADIIDKELSFTDRKCILQYGYDNGVDKLYTDEYTGQILDYSVEVRNGMLYYTITGYSGITPVIDNKLSFDAIVPDILEGNNSAYVDSGKTRPSQAAQKAIKDTFEKYGIKDYKVYIAEDVKDLPEDRIEGASDVTLFQYVDSVLAQARDETQPDLSTVDLADRITYTYVISDVEGSQNITIIKQDPKAEQSTKIIFNWMDRNDNLVIDFKTEFKGAILLNRKYSDKNNEEIEKYTLDDMGDPVVVESNVKNESFIVGNTANKDASKESTTWAKAVQHSYKATLVLQGMPCEIPIGTMIEVIPLIYGRPHHTQGKYMITKVTDTLDNSGFRTTLELVKMNAEEITRKE